MFAHDIEKIKSQNPMEVWNAERCAQANGTYLPNEVKIKIIFPEVNIKMVHI